MNLRQGELTVDVGGVTLHLSAHDTTDQGWIGQDVVLKQLLACWLVVDPTDLPLSPRLMGPPGIGKTTLVGAHLESIAARDGAAPVRIGRGVCIEQHGPREAYMPVIQALEGLARDRHAHLLELRSPEKLANEPVLTVVLLARTYWAFGDRAGAEQVLRQAVAMRPDEVLLLNDLGQLLEQSGRAAETSFEPSARGSAGRHA